MEHFHNELVAIDLETSGLHPRKHEIIEMAAVRLREGQLAEEFTTLVRPREKIPHLITRLTGLSPADFNDAPAAEEALSQFTAFIGSTPLIAHNAAFDLGFIRAQPGIRINNQVLDTLELSRIVCPQAGIYRLDAITRWLGISSAGYHRALEDARLTARLFIKLDEQLKTWNPVLVNEINQIGKTFNWALADYFSYLEAYLTRRFFVLGLQPGRLPSTSSLEGVFPADKQEKGRWGAGKAELPIAELEAMLSSQGVYSNCFPGFEFRPQQLSMLREVAEAFNQDRILLVEAGTGSGKSLAYLLPAVVWALTNCQRVVVSTHTLTLQQQLLEHDFPRLQQALNSLDSETDRPLFRSLSREQLSSLKIALAKGRNNYLCLRKWYSLQPEKSAYEPEQKSFFIRLLSWLQQTVSGDRRELNLSDRQPWWTLVASEAESCWGRKCPYSTERCFFMRARRRWEAADILVTNHALLLSDLNAESKVLPAYDRLIIDEAHHLEDLASEHLGIQVRETTINNFLQRLLQEGSVSPTGWLPQLQKQLNRSSWGAAEEVTDIENLLNSTMELLKECQRMADSSWNGLKKYVQLRQNGNDWFSRQYLRLLPEQRLEREWEAVELKFQDLLDSFQRLLLLLENLECRLQIEEGGADMLAGQIAVGKKIVADLKQILSLENRDWVYWIELEERQPGQIATLKASPVDVGEFLNAQLFSPKKTVVLTSATLTVENSFSYFMERVGLSAPNDRLSTMQLDSPFALERQVMLCILRGLPDPSRVGDREYAAAVAPVIIDLVRTVRGRTLVLFTSNNLLRETYFLIKDLLEQEDIVVMAQNIDGGQPRLLEEFRETPQSVILGSSSLWEGIDIPGEALSCVVIVRLPFTTPNLPLAEARIESLQCRNRNPFYSYSMPQAILRLKQGFGRLIRTQNDRGVVIILDNRVIDRPYGRRFLRALPINQHLRGELPAVKKRIADWLEICSGPKT